MNPEAAAIAIFSLATLGAATLLLVLRSPVGRALARRIEGGHAEGADTERVELLEHRVHDLEAAQLRVAELEDRVDFTERLLSRGRDAEQAESSRSL